MNRLLIAILALVVVNTASANEDTEQFYNLVCSDKSTLAGDLASEEALSVRTLIQTILANPEAEFTKMNESLVGEIKTALDQNYGEEAKKQIQAAVDAGQLPADQADAYYQQVLEQQAQMQAAQYTIESAVQFCGLAAELEPMITANGCTSDAGAALTIEPAAQFCTALVSQLQQQPAQ